MRILFTYKRHKSPFIQSDIDILRSFADVTEFNFTEIKRPRDLFAFARQFAHLVTNRYDAYYTYFVDYHGLLPLLFAMTRRKRSVFVVAGYDAMGIRDGEIRYGIFTASLWRRLIARFIYCYGSQFLTVSDALKCHLVWNGVCVDNRFKTVYMGFDASRFKIGRKRNICVMIGAATDDANRYRKGYDRFNRLRQLLPEYNFIAIGNGERVSHDHVLSRLSVAKVYIQPSRYEGFSAAVTEAMLCGCHIICSDADGLPENYPGYSFTQHQWDNEIELIAGTIAIAMRHDEPNMENRKAGERFTIYERMKQIKKYL